MITERNGLGRGNADGVPRVTPPAEVSSPAPAGSAAAGLAGTAASGSDSGGSASGSSAAGKSSGPPPWPGLALPSQRQGGQASGGPASEFAGGFPGGQASGDSGGDFSSEGFSGGSFPDDSFDDESFKGEPFDGGGNPGESLPAAPQEPAHEASFWDWAPADDSETARFSIDDESGAPAVTPAPDSAPHIFTDIEAPEDSPPRQEGIGHRLGRLDHIFGHTRMGFWRRRAAITIVVFVVVTLLLNWQLGVTLAVLVAIGDTVFRSRVVTNPLPGVRMSRAQRKTVQQLGQLEKSGYKALHSRLIPDSEDHIDHLVVGPAGVFSIDSEYWDKRLPIRTKNARQLWHGPFSMKERLEHARWEAERASELLSASAGIPVVVRPAMAVYGPKIPWDVATIRDVDVFSGARLRNYLRRYARHNNARPLSPADIDRVYRAAHGAFPHLNPGVLAS
jgi:hypothetical protein